MINQPQSTKEIQKNLQTNINDQRSSVFKVKRKIGKKTQFKTRIKKIEMKPDIVQTFSYSTNAFHRFNNNKSYRQKNNISSQHSRQRRKMYIKLLEQQINDLEIQVFNKEEELQLLRQEIFKNFMHTDEIDSNNASIHSHILKKLKALIEQNKHQHNRDNQINICLDSCIYRIGASGGQRQAILDILYKGLINRNCPNIYRYILWSAVNRKHMFQKDKSSSNDPFWNQIKEISQQIKQKNEAYLSQIGESICQKGKEILLCARNILRKREEIGLYCKEYDKLIETLRKILTPIQFTSLFLFIERSIHKKQLRIFQEEAYEEQYYDCLDLGEKH